jgi:hypothetical protein
MVMVMEADCVFGGDFLGEREEEQEHEIGRIGRLEPQLEITRW